MRTARILMTAVSCVVWTACGPPPPAQEPAPTSTPEAATSETSPSTDKAETQPKEGEIGSPTVADVCERICARAEKRCPKSSADECRENCKAYVKTAEQCEADVRRALRCQSKASDRLICANQPDSNCGQVFRNLATCERTGAPASQPPAQSYAPPPNWAKIRDAQIGFSVSMPPGAALDGESKRRTWRAEENGITYLVAQLDAPTGELTDKTLVKVVIGYLGHACQQRLRVRGRLDIKGGTIVFYDSACPDKSEWHGSLQIWKGKAVSVGFHAPAGAKGVLEPYFYSFEHD